MFQGLESFQNFVYNVLFVDVIFMCPRIVSKILITTNKMQLL